MSLISSDFALFLTLIFSNNLYLSCFMFFSPYLLKLLSFLSLLFITISLLLLVLVLMYRNFSSTTSNFSLSICTPNQIYTVYPARRGGLKVLSTLMMETKVDYVGKNFDEVLEVEEEVDKVVEVKEEYTENVTLCVKSHYKIVKDKEINEGRLNFESVSSNVGTYESMRKEKEWKSKIVSKLLEQHNVIEGEERIDSLWKIYALLDTYQSDSTTKSAQKSALVVKKKKKKKKKNRTRDLDYYSNEDDDVQMRRGQPGCLPFKCCAEKMNLRIGRTQIVRITKALKGIDLLPLHYVMKRRAWQKGQILI